MNAFHEQGYICLWNPEAAGIAPILMTPEQARVLMVSLALQVRDLDDGLRLANELEYAADLAEAWLAARDGWHESDFAGWCSSPPEVCDLPPDLPRGVRIAE